jgi:hypothetical protein
MPSGRMDWCIVPMEPPLLLGHGGPLLEVVHEHDKDLDGVGAVDGGGGVDGGAPWDDMCIDEAPRVKKS